MSQRKSNVNVKRVNTPIRSKSYAVRNAAIVPRRVSVTRNAVKTAYIAPKMTASLGRKEHTKEDKRSFGHKIGATLGGMVGHGIQNLVTSLTGFGDYHIAENSIFRGGIPPIEIVNSSKNGGCIVRHREFLGNIKNTSVFTNTVYPLNPGLDGTFPWLASVANAFEQYRFRGVVVEYKSTSSDSVLSTNASGSLGTVMIATQYDSIEPPFTNQQMMLNHEFANSRKPSEDFCHPVECKSDLTANHLYYVRNSAMVNNADERISDLGLLQVATEGMQGTPGTSSCGQLWITYEVELYKPRVMPGAPIGSILSDHFQLSGWSNSVPLGNTSTRSSTSSLKGTITTGNTYRFPASIIDGDYLVVICWKGATGVTCSYPNIGVIGGATFRFVWSNNTNGSEVSPPQGMVSQTNMMLAFLINVNGSGGGFSLGGSITLPGGANQPCDMFITQVDTDLIDATMNPDQCELYARRRHRNGSRYTIRGKKIHMPGDIYREGDDDIIINAEPLTLEAPCEPDYEGDLNKSIYEEVVVKKRVPARTP